MTLAYSTNSRPRNGNCLNRYCRQLNRPGVLGGWFKKPSGSAEEKIRRAIEAIQAYNEGKELGQMYRLSEANVHYLSGSRHGTIKAYFKAHPEVAGVNTPAQKRSFLSS